MSRRLPGARTRRPGRFTIGARIRITADTDGDGTATAIERQLREVVSGSSNAASTSSLAGEVGLGQATYADLVTAWPSGVESAVSRLAADQLVVLEETELPLVAIFADGFESGELNAWTAQ